MRKPADSTLFFSNESFIDSQLLVDTTSPLVRVEWAPRSQQQQCRERGTANWSLFRPRCFINLNHMLHVYARRLLFFPLNFALNESELLNLVWILHISAQAGKRRFTAHTCTSKQSELGFAWCFRWRGSPSHNSEMSSHRLGRSMPEHPAALSLLAYHTL